MKDERTSRPTTDESGTVSELQAEIARELVEERPPAGGPVYQVVGALFAVAIGLSGAILAYGYGLGSLHKPGPGLWPFVVSVAIVVLGGLLLVAGRHLADAEAFTRASVVPAIGIVTFIGLAILIPLVGFEIPSLLLCGIWLRLLGGESWRITIVASLVTVAAFYGLFIYALGIQLPHRF